MYTNSGTTESYIKLFALLLVLNVLWFSVVDTGMRRLSQSIHTLTDVTFYIIHRIFSGQNIYYQQVRVRIYLSGLFDIQL